MAELDSHHDPASLSKRAARRLIQRAWVLTGRDRRLRQHIRELNLTTLWVIEDWGLAWTVFLERGRIEFDRRPAKKPHTTFAWQGAREFFACIEDSVPLEKALAETESAGLEGSVPVERALEPVCRVFATMLREVLRNPFDENGDPLV